MRKQLVADIALLAVVMVWGYTFVAIKNALLTVTPINFIFIRFVISLLVILVIFRKRLRRLNFGIIRHGGIIGTFLFLAYVSQTAGLKYTTASNAGFITGFSVVLVPVFSSLLLRKKPSVESTIGVTLAVAGLFLLSFNGVSSMNRGDILVFLCAVCVAFHILSVGYYVKKHDSVLLTIVQIGTVTLLSFISALVTGEISVPSDGVVWRAILVCAVFATVGAYLVQTTMQKFTSATHTALIFSGEPVFAGVFGYCLLGENPGSWAFAGFSLILAGMIVSEIKISGRDEEV